MSRLPTFGSILLAATLVAACDPPAPPSERISARAAGAGSDTASEPLVDVPTFYGTHYLFLATEGAAPAGLALHFVGHAEPERYRQDHRGWLFDGREEWTRIAWDQRDGPPTRRPWRIFPTRGLRLIVGEQGEIAELLAAGVDRRVAIRIGPLLDRWEDPDAARRRIHQASVQGVGGSGAAPVSGLLLEEQAVRPRATAPPPFQSHDSAVLRLGGGDILVFSNPRGRDAYGSAFAWASLSGVYRRWDRLDVQVTERMNDTTVSRSVPASWRFTIPEPRLQGELTATGLRGSVLGSGGPGPVHLVYAVTGWVEVDGRRRDAAGLLEHGEP